MHRLALVCLLAGSLPAATARAGDVLPALDLKPLSDGYAAPIALTSLPDGSGRLVLADQAGLIHLLDPDGRRLEPPFLPLTNKLVKLNEGMDERGVTGIAFHPQFKSTRKFYVAYNVPLRTNAPSDWNTTMRVSEFRVPENAAQADANSERVVLEIDKPDWGHNSGRIAFGPDGYLYITCGDGGGPNDVGLRGHAPEGNGQNLRKLLGKILRIDVNRGSPYAIPSDNPFADGKKALPEIYAYGLRNPWGLSFDRATGDLISTDIGQERWEELNVIVKGGNYGWRLKEGHDGFDLKDTRSAPAFVPKTGALGEPLIDPVLVYKTKRGNRPEPDSFGVSVTGGYFYRGEAIPSLRGKYVFADWSTSMGFGDGCLLVATRPPAKSDAAAQWTAQRLPLKSSSEGRVKAFIWGLGEDEKGEIYVLTNGANLVSGTRGKVFKLVPQ